MILSCNWCVMASLTSAYCSQTIGHPSSCVKTAQIENYFTLMSRGLSLKQIFKLLLNCNDLK